MLCMIVKSEYCSQFDAAGVGIILQESLRQVRRYALVDTYDISGVHLFSHSGIDNWNVMLMFSSLGEYGR